MAELEPVPEVATVKPPSDSPSREDPEGAPEDIDDNPGYDQGSDNTSTCEDSEYTEADSEFAEDFDESMIIGDTLAVEVTLHKIGGMIGFSLTGVHSKKKGWRKGHRDEQHFVRSVVAGGPAAKDGRIEAGDKVIEINGIKLYGLPLDKVTSLIRRVDPVELRLVKHGAQAAGVLGVIQQPFVYSKYHKKEEQSMSQTNLFGRKSSGKHLPMAARLKKKLYPVKLLSSTKLKGDSQTAPNSADVPESDNTSQGQDENVQESVVTHTKTNEQEESGSVIVHSEDNESQLCDPTNENGVTEIVSDVI